MIQHILQTLPADEPQNSHPTPVVHCAYADWYMTRVGNHVGKHDDHILVRERLHIEFEEVNW